MFALPLMRHPVALKLLPIPEDIGLVSTPHTPVITFSLLLSLASILEFEFAAIFFREVSPAGPDLQ